jgi:hypothetical protein
MTLEKPPGTRLPHQVAKPVLAAALVLAVAACSSESPPQGAQSNTKDAPSQTGSSNVEVATPVAPKVPTITAPTTAASTPGDAREIEWDSLIPDDYRPDALLAEFAIDDIADDDPRAAELMDKLQALWDEAPVREELDGEQVRLPGFIVPVEADENETTGFLLVPYYGACIHVPPPPANQTVYVLSEAGKGTAPELFDVVWVTGTMSVNRIENDIAEAGYTLYASEIAPYEM